MNFLAHLFLSGDDPRIMTGNFLGDFIKGKAALSNLDPGVRTGVELHRAIDFFTDQHPVVRQSKNRLRPVYRHYAGVIVDMFYDHLLGVEWKRYSSEELSAFAQRAYANLLALETTMPDEAKRILPYLTKGNWLVGYASLEGLHRALSGMASRSRYETKMEHATDELRDHYDAFKNEFLEFFPELSDFSQSWRAQNVPLAN